MKKHFAALAFLAFSASAAAAQSSVFSAGGRIPQTPCAPEKLWEHIQTNIPPKTPYETVEATAARINKALATDDNFTFDGRIFCIVKKITGRSYDARKQLFNIWFHNPILNFDIYDFDYIGNDYASARLTSESVATGSTGSGQTVNFRIKEYLVTELDLGANWMMTEKYNTIYLPMSPEEAQKRDNNLWLGVSGYLDREVWSTRTNTKKATLDDLVQIDIAARILMINPTDLIVFDSSTREILSHTPMERCVRNTPVPKSTCK